jgi:hypothetical protein
MPLLHYNQYRNCEEAELFFRLKGMPQLKSRFLRHLFRNLSSEHEMTQIWVYLPKRTPSFVSNHNTNFFNHQDYGTNGQVRVPITPLAQN